MRAINNICLFFSNLFIVFHKYFKFEYFSPLGKQKIKSNQNLTYDLWLETEKRHKGKTSWGRAVPSSGQAGAS